MSTGAQAAKAGGGRAHRAVSDPVLRVYESMGLTQHDLRRYVARGFRIDALFGSHHQLAAVLGDRPFENHSPGCALPAIVAQN